MSNEQIIDESVDFGIVTALPVELDAVLAKFDARPQRIQKSEETYTFYRGQISNPVTGKKYEVAIVKMLQPGNVDAYSASEFLIRVCKPSNIIMLGIAGGDHKKINRGDIVIAQSILYYELAKVTPHALQLRPEQMPSNRRLLDRATSYRDSSWVKKIEIDRPDGTNLNPQVVPGVIASGEKVQATEDAFIQLQKQHSQIIAVAMEGFGVSKAVLDQNNNLGFIEIRGISDFADPDKHDDAWRPYAANAAAAYTIEFIKDSILPSVNENRITSTLTQRPQKNVQQQTSFNSHFQTDRDQLTTDVQIINQKIENIFAPFSSSRNTGSVRSTLHLAFVLPDKQEVLDANEFISDRFTNSVLQVARSGTLPLFNQFNQINPPRAELNRINFTQEQGRHPGENQVSLTLDVDGVVTISFTGLTQYDSSLLATNLVKAYYIDPDIVAQNLQKAFGFMSAWLELNDNSQRYSSIFYNITYLYAQDKYFDKAPPGGGPITVPSSMNFPPKLTIYESAVALTRDDLTYPDEKIAHAIERSRQRFKAFRNRNT